MKQTEIETGKSYLFANTDVEHRKNMIGQIVKVVGRRQRSRRYVNYLNTNAKPPMVFLLSNGQKANAANLTEGGSE